MIKKLTTKATIQNAEVGERTAQLTCYSQCKVDCRVWLTPTAWVYEENYEYIGY